MKLKDRLLEDLKDSMRSRERIRTSTLRLLLASVKNAEIAKQRELSEDEFIEIVSREARKRKEAIEEFRKGKREDLVTKETAELSILNEYLPEQIPEDELRKVILAAIEEMGASSEKDTGRIMGRIMPTLRGRASGSDVNRLVRELLSQR